MGTFYLADQDGKRIELTVESGAKCCRYGIPVLRITDADGECVDLGPGDTMPDGVLALDYVAAWLVDRPETADKGAVAAARLFVETIGV